ncbi:MAG TPA: O-antigen ligase family protein [Candidatus Woesebacteria bacterium]|nr:O-antigen ligase family protein [Candidatus Woesebacteria bacterium]HNS94591.1 O-antigen ligase family protein [Candidatus Woesebacteria bacterium]
MKWHKLLSTFDRHILTLCTLVLLVIIPLYPKIPFIRIHDTYIAIRLEDFYVALMGVVFVIQFLRRKIQWHRQFTLLFFLFWSSVFISLFFNIFVSQVITFRNIGFLHALRRVEYMFPFFVAFAAVQIELLHVRGADSHKRILMKFLNVSIWVTLLVSLYALGQKSSILFQPVRDVFEWMSVNSYGFMKDVGYFFFRFFDFPAVQTMNAEFAKGHLLKLTPESRVSATFAGHYDLAAYLVFLIPIVAASISYTTHKIRGIFVYILAITTLILTASRISFGAFVFSITLYFVFTRKWRGLVLTALLTFVLLLMSRDMTNRFMDMFQKTRVFENVQTGAEIINQEIEVTTLPAGSHFVVQGGSAPVVSEKDKKDLQKQLVKKEIEEAKKSGRVITEEDAIRLVNEKYKEFQSFVAKDVVAGDTSLATRTQVEWPRAWRAFLANPILGTGPSSLTESTDGDYFRWFGEMGALGALLFMGILALIGKTMVSAIKNHTQDVLIIAGFCAGFIALLVNAILIDVFEASKVAFIFWTITGLYIGIFSTSHTHSKHA